MKKLLLLFITFFVSISVFSQEHNSFMGISFANKIDSLEAKLQAKGFIKIDSHASDGRLLTYMDGLFAGRKADILIESSIKTKLVYDLLVSFQNEYTYWENIKSDYFKLKKSLIKKYGDPSDVYEEFLSPYYEGDGYEMTALRANKVNYVSKFSVSGGYIALEISPEAKIVILYVDQSNTDAFDKEKEEQADNDL